MLSAPFFVRKEDPAMRHPPKPPMEPGILLPRIIAHERLSMPCCPAELHPSGLPCSAQPPFRLQSVCVCGQTLIQPSCTPGAVVLHIPLHVQLCDSCGKTYTACAEVDVETRAPRSMEHCRHHLLWTSPDVRLLECVCGDSCFHVKLCILADLYLLRLEPCMNRPPRPSCPQLPLYPPPMH